MNIDLDKVLPLAIAFLVGMTVAASIVQPVVVVVEPKNGKRNAAE
jgi:hypothetical protein